MPNSKPSDWREEVERALEFADATAGESVVATRNALYALWLAADGTPQNVRDLYRQFDEAELVRSAEVLGRKDLASGVPIEIGTNEGRRSVLFALAVRIRFVESLLHEMAGEDPVRQESECLATYGDEQAFILLRNPRHRAAATKQSFRRRGLRSSRIFPRKVRDYQVRLLLPDDPRGRTRAEARGEFAFGTGLFQNLSFEFGHDKGGFFIQDVKAPDQVTTIRQQIADASRSDCGGIVYPELTITQQTLHEVCTGIGEGEWTCNLSVLVAGSRHEEIGSRRYNICSILSGHGEEIAQHRKLFQYTDGSNEAESIELGEELQILILPDAIFAFGICLDFCNTGEDPPYAELDVDYVLVPSCGNESTIDGHIKRSALYMDKWKTRTLVVQQFYQEKPPANPPLGWVLARRDGATLDVKGLEKREAWGIYNI
jgi:hypothetical protein